MDKREYFIKMINKGLYMNRDWIITTFCAVRNRPTFNEAKYDGQVITKGGEDTLLYFFDKESNSAIPIEDTNVKTSVLNFRSVETIKAGEIPLVESDIATTYGIFLGNMIMLHYPFGTKHPFVNGVITSKQVDWITERLVDNPPNGGDVPADKVSVKEFVKFGESCGYISSLATYFASSGSSNTTTVNPAVLKLRDQLYKKYEGKLHDRTVQAIIEEELVKADKTTFENDPDGKAYLTSGKAFNPVRKKTYLSVGGTSGFGGENAKAFIGNSLREKWKVEDIHHYANEARSGSYFRGKETQYGGYETKLAYRMAMTSTVAEDFCKANRGMAISFLPTTNLNYYIGRNVVTKNGPVELTAGNVGSLVGKRVMIHSPQYCQTDGGSYCAICMGKKYSQLRSGVPSVVAHIGDVLMYDKMKRMHGKALVTFTVAMQNIMY